MRHKTALLFSAGFVFMLAAGWAGFPALLYKKAEQPVQFNHRVHKEKGSMQCQDCHAIREDGSFAGIPSTENCAGCHQEPMGTTAAEKKVVTDYVKPGKPIPWLVYARQPMNVRFSHAVHVKRAKLACDTCHGPHGTTATLAAYEENRISGYSRQIWGKSMARVGVKAGEGMKMTDCESCHADKGVETSCLGCHQ